MSDMLIGFLLGASLVTLPITIAIILGFRWYRKTTAGINARREETRRNYDKIRASIHARRGGV
ncbi:hypothetical protein [Croceibacterium ferulae]|uniref:hypothetical protein n=1 Tax=Croceibacterium ferulae TaxID=1854641 RepID=UPI000EB437F8|nr:hypothetical protein [Croceibacterium ferulae]